MSCSKPLPPFTYDLLYYLNRDQLERFSIICRPLKNFIERYFHSKPYRVFDFLLIRGGMYALAHNVQSKEIQWHPNRNYSVQQFLAGQTCIIERSFRYTCYSFAEMMPYLGPTDFSFAVSLNAFKIIFIQCQKLLIEFRETNMTSGEILELKKGLPAKYQKTYLEGYNNYTLERSSI